MVSKIINYTQNYPFTSLAIVMVVLFCYQSLNIFWGFEILDSGYHLTAYDNIFDAPDSVSANFCYYLTNVLGGVFMNFFPGIGIVGFRIIGALFIDSAILLIFLCLRKEIPVVHLLVGSVLVVMSYIQIPYSFNNGICSCFFYVCALLSLYKGLTNKKMTHVFMSGFFVGINIFSRIPNVLAVGLVLITLFHSYIENRKLRCDKKSSFFFLLGVMTGIGLMFFLIISLGHQQIFVGELVGLFQQGTSPDEGYFVGNLIWTLIFFYLEAVIYLSLFFAVLFADRNIENQWLKILFVGSASFVIFYHVYLNAGYESLWAICSAGCGFYLIRTRVKNLALLSTLAIFMLLVEIMGSGGGNNHGCLPALLAAPVASNALINRKNLVFVAVVCLALLMKVFKQGTFFDFGPLYQKNCSINVEECSLIKTTAERAEVMNATLPTLKRYVQPGDTLLVYDSAPMLNYLTHSRPAGGVCWPGVCSISKPFESAPKILITKFVDLADPTPWTRGIPTGNMIIDTYIIEHHYKTVWENPYFILLFPQK